MPKSHLKTDEANMPKIALKAARVNAELTQYEAIYLSPSHLRVKKDI